MIATDPYAKKLFAKVELIMTAFPDLKKEDIEAVLDWADAYTPVTNPNPPPGGGGGEENSLLYGLLTLILVVIAFILLQVNSNLKKLSDEKQGIRTPNPVPFYRNKAYLLIRCYCIVFNWRLLYYTVQPLDWADKKDISRYSLFIIHIKYMPALTK